jgi:hypothetical protein
LRGYSRRGRFFRSLYAASRWRIQVRQPLDAELFGFT